MRTSISERSLAEELKHRAGATLAQTPAIHCSRSLLEPTRENAAWLKQTLAVYSREETLLRLQPACPSPSGGESLCVRGRTRGRGRRAGAGTSRIRERQGRKPSLYPSDVADHEEPLPSFYEKRARGRSPSKGCDIIEISFGEIPPPHQPRLQPCLIPAGLPAPLSAAVAPPPTHPRGLHHHPSAGRGAVVPRA